MMEKTKSIDVQDKEEACIRRVCKHFGWLCDVAPNPLAKNYEMIKLRPREYIPLTSYRAAIKFFNSTRGEGTARWYLFEDFLELLDVVEWFDSCTSIEELILRECITYSVPNPFYGKHLKTIEEVSIFLDLLEAAEDIGYKEA